MITADEIIQIMRCNQERAAQWQPHLAHAMDMFFYTCRWSCARYSA
jgi:hypothetical protein